MEFNIGDTVYINSLKWVKSDESSMAQFGFAPDMKKYCGCKAIIKEKHVHLDTYLEYYLDIDKGFWAWTEGMFNIERIKKEIRKQKLKKINESE